MTGSMYASIAGLKAHMQKLSVIGNNIANVNTQGYKKQRTIFRDTIYGMYSGGSNGTEVVGGMNPSQLGYGSVVASIDLDMSSSSYSPGNATDCAIVGDGFFLVGNKEIANSIDGRDPESFKSLTLSRVGDFYFGPDGYLVDGQGNVVYGFMNTGTGSKPDPNSEDPEKTVADISDQLVPIRLPRWQKMPDGTYRTRYAQVYGTKGADGKPTGYATVNDVGKLVKADGTDIEAGTLEVGLYDYQYKLGEGGAITGEELDFAKFSSFSIDAGSGAITGIRQEGDVPVVIGYLAVGYVSNPNGVAHVDSSYYRCQEGAGALSIGMIGGAGKSLGINQINSYQAKRQAANQGDESQYATIGEDVPVNYKSGTDILNNGATKMMVGFLETSNTDLATEISELITTQRGYQANTRIVTVTDSMLEELVNMKR